MALGQAPPPSLVQGSVNKIAKVRHSFYPAAAEGISVPAATIFSNLKEDRTRHEAFFQWTFFFFSQRCTGGSWELQNYSDLSQVSALYLIDRHKNKAFAQLRLPFKNELFTTWIPEELNVPSREKTRIQVLCMPMRTKLNVVAIASGFTPCGKPLKRFWNLARLQAAAVRLATDVVL